MSDPNTFYRAARAKFDADQGFARRARARVVALQAEDPETLGLWRELVDLSKHYFNRIYARLAVTLTDDDLAGESTYNDRLASICEELEDSGIATMSEGALCVSLDGNTGRDGKPVPLIIRKSDGGYGYATTDLATIRYRVEDLDADRILYVIGAPQALHLTWSGTPLAGPAGCPRPSCHSRADRERPRYGPQDPQDPVRSAAAADHPAGRGREQGSSGDRGEASRPRRSLRAPSRPRSA